MNKHDVEPIFAARREHVLPAPKMSTPSAAAKNYPDSVCY